MKYRVKYTSIGVLSGNEVGDLVRLTEDDAKRLLDLGIVETEADYAERLADAQMAGEDAELEPFRTGAGWYTFPALKEGEEPTKVRGREAALAELTARREAANAADTSAGQQPK